MIQPFPKQIILDSSILKDLAVDNFRFDENGKKYSKRVENTVGKGEIARNFSLSHSVFKRFEVQTRKNQGLFWKGLILSQQALAYSCRQYMSFENAVGKREIACSKQFRLLPLFFLPLWRNFGLFNHFKLSSAKFFSL